MLRVFSGSKIKGHAVSFGFLKGRNPKMNKLPEAFS